MERFKNCHIKVRRELVTREAKYKYGSLTNFAKELKISNSRLQFILKELHISPKEESIKKIAKKLGKKVEEIVDYV